MNNLWYPFLFEQSLHEKVWGGTALATRYGKSAAEGALIGESFEIFSDNRIANGRFAGRTLASVIAEFPQETLGIAKFGGDYPLLVKLLDAREWLSVQVHPDDALAAELEGQPRGKTECWYILAAEPDSQIVYGFRDGITKTDIRNAIARGEMRGVLRELGVQAGDFVPVPAGTVHAIGAGIVLYELQQTSDTTYRLYDWDRPGLDGKPRELHIEKGLHCATEKNEPEDTFRTQEQTAAPQAETELYSNDYFQLKKLMITGAYPLVSLEHEHLLTVVEGTVTITDNRPLPSDAAFLPVDVPQGTSAFLPAALNDVMLHSSLGATVMLARRMG